MRDGHRKPARQAPNGRGTTADRSQKIVQRRRNGRQSVLHYPHAARAGHSQRGARQRGGDRWAVADPRALVRGGAMNPDVAAGQPPPARAAFVTSTITFRYLNTTERAAAAVLLPFCRTPAGETGREEVRAAVAIQSRGRPRHTAANDQRVVAPYMPHATYVTSRPPAM